MRDEVWGETSPQQTVTLLRDYVHASSALSFAARALEYTDADVAEVHKRAGDYVEASRETVGRKAVRNTTHGWLHVADTIRDHGEVRSFI
ncbi:unnamed protein product [Laminaria digitata]